MDYLAISGETLFLCLAGTAAVIITFILCLRGFIKQRKNNLPVPDNQHPLQTLAERSKYTQVNIFKLSGTFFNVGLLLSLAMTILAFSWTTYDHNIKYAGELIENLDEVEVIPRTTLKRLPPPLPPTVIDEVEPDEIEPEDEIEFVDIDIDEPVPVELPPAPVVDQPKVIVPPPPPEPEIEDLPFTVVEEMPRFPGCENISDREGKKICAQQKMLAYIYDKINYPPVARQNGIEGLVVIRFYVDRDGSIKAPEILKNIGGGCGAEAIRVIQTMNDMEEHWSPGKQRGKPVKVYFNLPVKYRLN